jgi:hypothetical protein
VKSARVGVALSRDEHAELRRRAKLHRVSMAQYVRMATLSTSNTARSADQWWDELPPDRRDQVHRWLTKRLREDEPTVDQVMWLFGPAEEAPADVS